MDALLRPVRSATRRLPASARGGGAQLSMISALSMPPNLAFAPLTIKRDQ
jgi:hypothetical protein